MSGSPLLRLDPRAKLLVLLTLLVLFLLPLPLGLEAGYLALVALLFLPALGPAGLGRALRPILPFLVLILLLTPPFIREGRVLLAVAGHPLLTSVGLGEALRLVTRFAGLSLAFTLYARTTLAEELLAALRTLGVPFTAALVATLTLRTIPRIARLHRNVLEARSLRQGEGRRPGRLAARLPELTPILVQAVRGIPVLAMVLESRGVGRRDRRSRFLPLKSGRALAADLLAAALAAGLLAAPALFV